MAPNDHDRQATALAVSKDSRWAAVGFYGGTVHVWDLHADDPVTSERIIRHHADSTMLGKNAFRSMQTGPALQRRPPMDESYIWDLTCEVLEPIRELSHKSLKGIAISSDGRWVATADDSRSLGCGTCPAHKINSSVWLKGGAGDVVFSDDDKYLAVGGTVMFSLRLNDRRCREYVCDVGCVQRRVGIQPGERMASDWRIRGSSCGI